MVEFTLEELLILDILIKQKIKKVSQKKLKKYQSLLIKVNSIKPMEEK